MDTQHDKKMEQLAARWAEDDKRHADQVNAIARLLHTVESDIRLSRWTHIDGRAVPVSLNSAIVTLSGALADLKALTSYERSQRNAQYLDDAPTDAVCVMDWTRCTERFCMRYASGCPYYTEDDGPTCPRCHRVIADVSDGEPSRIMDVTDANEEWSGVELCVECAEYLDPTEG